MEEKMQYTPPPKQKVMGLVVGFIIVMIIVFILDKLGLF
jgi:hypothetical protein